MALPEVKLVSSRLGKYLTFATDSVIRPSLEARGGFEEHLSRIAIAICGKRPRPGVLVDAGAFIGTFSIPVALSTGCSVVAFEAQRVIAQLLGANFLLNGIESARLHNVILGGPGHPPSQAIRPPDYGRAGNFAAFSVDAELLREVSMKRMALGERTEAVAVKRLDDFALDDVFLVKLDVEGQELDVLKGAVATLERNRFPPLIFEAWREEQWAERKQTLIEFVEDLGYVVQPMDENFLAQHLSMPDPLRL